VPPDCADPDHIHDWVVGHPDEWVQVFRLEEYAPDSRQLVGTELSATSP
jgi:hypothetical protein